jgi:hypothetical protein
MYNCWERADLRFSYENRGVIQYIEEEKIENSIQYFLTLIEDRPGLIITRRYPEWLKQEFEIPDLDIYWLSMNFAHLNYISPNNLPRLINVIISFLENNPDGVIMLEGVEYLASQNGYQSTIRFLQYLRDRVSLTSGLILISMDPLAFPIKEVHQIKREGSVVDETLLDEIMEEAKIKIPRARI